MIKGRYIHTRASSRQVPDLLQAIFASELVSKSRCIWVISPWITDIPVIDNRANQFLSMEPLWAGRHVRLSEVIHKLLSLGTTVQIATRPIEHNKNFIDIIKIARKEGLPAQIHIASELHEKGILGDYYYLSGSMNFTYNGISLNEESVHYDTNKNIVAENRVVLANRWGSEINVG